MTRQCSSAVQWPGYSSRDYQVNRLILNHRGNAEDRNSSCGPSIGAHRPTRSHCQSSPRRLQKLCKSLYRYVCTIEWAEPHVKQIPCRKWKRKLSLPTRRSGGSGRTEFRFKTYISLRLNKFLGAHGKSDYPTNPPTERLLCTPLLPGEILCSPCKMPSCRFLCPC